MKHKRSRHSHSIHLARVVFYLWVPVVLVIIGVMIYRGIRTSLFFTPRDRIQVVLYGTRTSFLSLGLQDNIVYRAVFPADLNVVVPGGYGLYRVGALGKLQALEHNPMLLPRAFELATGSVVHYYFLLPEDTIFYGDNQTPMSVVSDARLFLTGVSNASLVDRIYLLSYFLQRKQSAWRDVPLTQNTVNGDLVLDAQTTRQNLQGLFYDSMVRNENESVQIQYNAMYDAAQNLAYVMEGSGINVSDMSVADHKGSGCFIDINHHAITATVEELRSLLPCPVRDANTGVYDILIILGDREKEWK